MCRRFDPLFWHSEDWTRSFWGTFSHPPTAKLSFGVQKLPIFTKIDLFGPKLNFFLDLFGSNFQRPAAHPHQFSGRVPPRVHEHFLRNCSQPWEVNSTEPCSVHETCKMFVSDICFSQWKQSSTSSYLIITSKFWLKCRLEDPSFLRKWGHYFKNNFTNTCNRPRFFRPLLTLKMLNCFKDYKTCMYIFMILYHILDFI